LGAELQFHRPNCGEGLEKDPENVVLYNKRVQDSGLVPESFLGVKHLSERIQPEENKMGVMPVNKLLLTMAWPMMVSMLVQAMYNVVDSIFVSRLSENALTAVSLAFRSSPF
jgi:hypothetical protein